MRVISDPSYGVVVLVFDDNEDKQNMINNLQGMGDEALLYASFPSEKVNVRDMEKYLDKLKMVLKNE